MSAAVDKVISALDARGCRPKRSGKGYRARCPAHDDKSPSLSVAAGSDGRALVYCHAKCSADAIAQALNLQVADLFADSLAGLRCKPSKCRRRPQYKATKTEVKATPTKTYKTWHDAVAGGLGGNATASWEYRNRDNVLVGIAARRDRPDGGKEIRPATVAPGGGWVAEAMPEPRPIYNLPAVMTADLVLVAEGEKAAASINALGLVCTTSSMGAQSAGKSDWSPLAGKRVVILPDHDEAGEDYARDVARLAAEAGATSVSVCRLADQWPACPAGGDVADWIEGHGDAAEPADIRAALEAIIAKAEPVPAATIDEPTDEEPAPWVSFPCDVLPEPLATFVSEAAAGLQTDGCLVAAPLLAAVAASIGMSRAIEVKPGWQEYPILWLATVADSGSSKTPAMAAALQFLKRRQADAFKANVPAHEQWERDMLHYEAELAKWKKDSAAGKNRGGPPERPEEPHAPRCLLGDVTIEALATVIGRNTRGVLVARDELSSWLSSFDRYRSGKGGSDVGNWLELWSGEDLNVTRKGQPPLYVERAAASVVGGIPPGPLARAIGRDHAENGLLARLLLCMPPRQAKTWDTRAVSFATMQSMQTLFDTLFLLRGTDDGPVVLDFTPDGLAEWKSFYNSHNEELRAASGAIASMLSKAEAYCARLALIVHVARQAGNEPTLGNSIDAESVRRAVVLVRWFVREQRRVYATLGHDNTAALQPADDARHLERWLADRGGRASDRDVRKGLARFRDDQARADAAVQRLVAEGRAVRETTVTGGRPSRGVRLIGEPFGAFGAGAA